MTQEVAKIPAAVTLLGDPPWIRHEHELSWHLNSDVNPDPSSKKYDPVIRECARLYLRALEPFSAPVSREVLLEWLDPIPSAVRNEKSPEAMAGWLSALIIGLADIEAGAFTAKTQRSALQTFQFFPSVADVYSVIMPTAIEIRDKVRVLKIIAREPAP